MRDWIRVGLLLAGMATLGGCVEALPTAQGGAADFRAEVTGGPAQARGVRIALASLDGPPEAVRQRFERAFAQQAAARQMIVSAPDAAGYLARGYLDAAPSGSGAGTDVTFVYDVFDAADHRRLDRVTDTLTLPATHPDAWAVVDDRVIDSLAARSADRLAQALAGAPDPRPTTTAEAQAHPAGAAVN